MPRQIILAVFAIVMFATGPVAAQRVNLAYVADAPQPIGKLTPQQMQALAQSDFTHLVFAFINLCDIAPTKDHCIVPAGNTPSVVWNIAPVYDAQGQPFADAQAGMKAIADAGKVIYMSVGAAVNPETWDYMASASPSEATAAGSALQKFMADYHVTGVDFDYEAGSSDGFGALARTLGALTPQPPFSAAPYRTDLTATDTKSTQWQWCQFLNAGITPALMNRQYYAGGFPWGSTVEAALAGDLKEFNCSQAGGSGDTISIPAAHMTPGIGIEGIEGMANCAPAAQPPVYAACAAIGEAVVQAQPSVGGMSLWRADLLTDPVAYSCEMANAVNGTDKACN